MGVKNVVDVTAFRETHVVFDVEGLLGEKCSVAVNSFAEKELFGNGQGDFDFGYILDDVNNTVVPFWFEQGYWVKV